MNPNSIGGVGYAVPMAQMQQPGAPVRVSEVQQQVERGVKLTSALEDYTSQLYTRLSSVLRVVPQGQSSQQEGKPTLVGHAMSLSNHNDQLELVASALRDILDRLEL